MHQLFQYINMPWPLFDPWLACPMSMQISAYEHTHSLRQNLPLNPLLLPPPSHTPPIYTQPTPAQQGSHVPCHTHMSNTRTTHCLTTTRWPSPAPPLPPPLHTTGQAREPAARAGGPPEARQGQQRRTAGPVRPIQRERWRRGAHLREGLQGIRGM